MKLTIDDVISLAREARFELSEVELERFRAQLNSVLEKMQMLDEIDLHEQAPSKAGQPVRLREDFVGADPLGRTIEDIAAEVIAGFFTVPRVVPAEPKNRT